MYENSPVIASNSVVHTPIGDDDDDNANADVAPQRQSSMPGEPGTLIVAPSDDDPYGVVPKFLIVASDYATPHIDGDASGYAKLHPKPPPRDDVDDDDEYPYGVLPDGVGFEQQRVSKKKSGDKLLHAAAAPRDAKSSANAPNEYGRIEPRYRKDGAANSNNNGNGNNNARKSSKDKLACGERKSSRKALERQQRKASSKEVLLDDATRAKLKRKASSKTTLDSTTTTTTGESMVKELAAADNANDTPVDRNKENNSLLIEYITE